jgi:heme/copper-type cytochrome/quinol oxidase subunit 2
MKKTIIIFIISALLLVSVAIWALKGHFTGNVQEILTAAGIFILVGFALFIGVSRLRSHARREPSEDELSKRVMTKATSLAYYISIYLWLFVMYVSDKVSLPVDSLIGAGILGMALAFFCCWLYLKARGVKNE